MKKEFTIVELQNISLLCSVLRECNGVKPFALAMKFHSTMKAAELALKDAKEQLNLINDRTQQTEEMDGQTRQKLIAQQVEEAKELMSRTFEIEIPEIYEREFEHLEIEGEKTMPRFDQNGAQVGTYQLGNRQAYFGLLGSIIQS